MQRLSLTIDLVLGGVAVLVTALLLTLLRRRLDDLTERSERAYPGPLE